MRITEPAYGRPNVFGAMSAYDESPISAEAEAERVSCRFLAKIDNRGVMTTTLKSLQRETARLERKLQDLVDRYPERDLDPDERILNRLLTTHWRHQHGGVHGPHERRYWEAVEWVKQFHAYLNCLGDYFRYEAEQPERLGNQPLSIALAPSAPEITLPLSAQELIHKLKLQQRMLARWAGGDKGPSPPPSKEEREIRAYLQSQCDVKGIKVIANEIGCDRDTLSAFLNQTTKPHEETLRKFRAYRQS